MSSDHVIMPDDYRALLAEPGPGTLAGILRLLAPGGPEGFNMGAEQEAVLAGQESLFRLGVALGTWEETDEDEDDDDVRALTDARLWGVFTTGETCWWLPVREDAAHWLLVIIGHGWQQLNISTTEFLRRWTGGLLDLPVLAHGAVAREWHITPAGQPVAVPDVPQVTRDPLAQLKTIVGPGHATPVPFDWAAIETGLGRPLPPDYKLLHQTYGSLTDGVTNNRKALFFDGITFPPPLGMKKAHEYYAEHGLFARITEFPDPSSPSADELLLCCTTESRDLLAWDTRDPNPARWPVINLEWAGPTVFPATATQLLIANLCGTGLGLTFSRPGDPATWAYPIWGPDAPWEN
jgi:hypothetical protein